MRVIEGNLLNVRFGIIGHQVNCRRKMGAGLALQVRQRFPEAAAAYLSKADWQPGDALFCAVGPDMYIVHLAGQRNYGRGQRYTDYEALGEALGKASAFAHEKKLPLCLPYGIGCGLAGGDWRVVEAVIGKVCPEAVLYRFTPEGEHRRYF